MYFYALLVLVGGSLGALTLSIIELITLLTTELTINRVVKSTFVASFGFGLGTFLLVNFGRLARAVERALTKFLSASYQSSTQSVSESVSAAERLVASSGDVMVREFQSRIQKEIDAAVSKLSATSEQLIRTQLAERIDAVVGNDIVSVLGAKLASETNNQAQLNRLKQDAHDRFIQMRNRALQYAEAARTQAAYFRWIGILLALGGLIVLGIVLYVNQQQFIRDPSLLERHVEWSMFLLRHGATYAFVVLCEFLALIMFRYQSKALEYMRYFSNEGTNIDARQIAFMSAVQFMDKTKLTKLIERIEATERNFLIGKDQRTLELANNENEDRLFERFKKMMTMTQPSSRKSKSKGDSEEA